MCAKTIWDDSVWCIYSHSWVGLVECKISAVTIIGKVQARPALRGKIPQWLPLPNFVYIESSLSGHENAHEHGFLRPSLHIQWRIFGVDIVHRKRPFLAKPTISQINRMAVIGFFPDETSDTWLAVDVELFMEQGTSLVRVRACVYIATIWQGSVRGYLLNIYKVSERNLFGI